MDRKDYIRYFWTHYKTLENKLLSTSDYVAINKDNNAMFSNEYLTLMILICNEIDSVTTELCRIYDGFDPKDSGNKMYGTPRKIRDICAHEPKLVNMRTTTKVEYSSINTVPFAEFKDENAATLSWWKDYNNIKHDRVGKDKERGDKPYLQRGNLSNVVTTLSALYILSSLLYKELGECDSTPNELNSDFFDGVSL